MAGIRDRISGLGPDKEEDNKLNNPLNIPSTPMTAAAVEDTAVKDPEEVKNLAATALNEPQLRDWFEKQKQAINNKFASKEKDVQRRKMVETLTQAATQFGAALAGSKTGVDLSNLDFIKQDFEKELDRAAREREVDVAGARQELGERRKFQELIEARKERKAEREARHLDTLEQIKARATKSNKPLIYKSADDIVKINPDESVTILHKGRRTDVSEKSLEERIRRGDEPSGPQMEQLASFKEATDLLKKMREQKVNEDIDTGPVASMRNYLAQFVGVDDPKVSKLKQDLVDTLARKVKTLSGAAASDKEREFLSLSLPRLQDNDEQFLTKLDNALVNIESAKQARLDAFEKGGRNVKKFKDDEVEAKRKRLEQLRAKKAGR